MPEPVIPDVHPTAGSEEFRILLEDHLRLRAELDQLKRDQQEKKDDGGKEGEKKEGDKKEEEKQPALQPPLRQRAGAWVKGHPIAFVLIIIGAVAVVIGGMLLLQYLNSYISTDDAQIDGHIHQISSRVAGTVTGVYIENNRSVEPGQTLLGLDEHDYRASLAQAQAQLAQATSELQAAAPNVPITRTNESTNTATAELEVTNAQAALQQARQTYQAAVADLHEAEANAANAAVEEERYRHLAEKQEVSREAYDQRAAAAKAQAAMVASRKASADAAEKTVEQRQIAVDEARTRERQIEANMPRQVAVQHANVASREASVKAAAAQVSQAGLNLSYVKILAPAAGIVGDRSVEVGQQVVPGQELLAITETAELWVTANFKETQIEQMHPGQRATIHVDAIDLAFEGYVENMAGATGARYSLLPPENATGNYVKVVQRLPVRLRFKQGQRYLERLRPGMSVEPKVWIK